MPELSSSDLYLTAAACRHERANRLWIAKRRGHRAKAIGQLQRLEDIYTALGRAQQEREQEQRRIRE